MYYVLTIKLKKPTGKKLGKIIDANPKAKRGTPFFLVKLIGESAKDKTIRASIKNGSFGELMGWMKHGKELTEEECFEDEKSAIIYHQRQIDQSRKEGNRVWPSPPDDPTYSVYVIKLTEKAFEKRKFAKANEGVRASDCKGPLYIGQTGNTIEYRVMQHIRPAEDSKPASKEIGSDVVRGCNAGEYPECVAWEYCEENLRKADSLKREEELGMELRKAGFATYWA